MTAKSLLLTLDGTTQGLGIRPRIYQLAKKFGIGGFVRNDTCGVHVLISGPTKRLDALIAAIESMTAIEKIQPQPYQTFETFHIYPSQGCSGLHAIITPDLKTCQTCIDEMMDPHNRRFGYNLISCIECGPRYSISYRLPYDRANTSMQPFSLCNDCHQEYHDEENRRFWAQTISCAQCGPQWLLLDSKQRVITQSQSAVDLCIQALKQGRVVAFKGIGGYQLLACADHDETIMRIRAIKQRPDKPLAVMVADIVSAKALCSLTEDEALALQSPMAPIVIARKHPASSLSPLVAPNLAHLGIMLPTTGTHHLICRNIGKPIIVTSANHSQSPILFDDQTLFQHMGSKVDLVLMHDRKIVNPVDDSIVKRIANHIRVLRLARGGIPYICKIPSNKRILSLGTHLKNTTGITRPQGILLSPYIGDLTNESALARHQQQCKSLIHASAPPHIVIQDHHPSYHTNQSANHFKADQQSVFHHHAHIYAAMAEYGLRKQVLGIAWDGNGYGEEDVMWGGETFIATPQLCKRVFSIRPFQLPGAEQAIREPYRIGLSLLHQTLDESLDIQYWQNYWQLDTVSFIYQMLKKKVNTILCTSIGRLFDGVAALLNLYTKTNYEAQAAMALEDLAMHTTHPPYPVASYQQDHITWFDWRPMISEMLEDIKNEVAPCIIAGKFHAYLSQIILCQAKHMQLNEIVLSGGVFQNNVLSSLATNLLIQHGFTPYLPKDIPMNDSGISLGQAFAAIYQNQTLNKIKQCV